MIVSFCYNFDYYPFGMVTPGRSFSAGDGYRFGFNGQEQVNEVYGDADLNTATFWEYDLRLCRRWNIDPVVTHSLSAYLVFFGNPIVLIDYEGDLADWFKEKNGTLQFDPKVNSQDDLKESEEYVGTSFKESNPRGNTYYREDGSIYYENQQDAYNRVWNNSLNKTNGKVEQFAVGLNDGVLVTPDYKNKLDEATPSLYNYELVNNQIYDPVTKEFYNIVFTMHTHVIGTADDIGPSNEDVRTFGHLTPGTPSYIFSLYNKSVVGFIADPAGWEYFKLPKEIRNLDAFLNSDIDLIELSKKLLE